MNQSKTDVSLCVWWGDFRKDHGRITLWILLLVLAVGLLLFYYFNNSAPSEKQIPLVTNQYEEGKVTKAVPIVSELALTSSEEKIESPVILMPLRVNLLKKPEAKAKKKKSSAKAMGVAYLPMARKGEISSPTELAIRIRKSLEIDSSGNKIVKGANDTPNDFLSAIKNAGGTVDGVGALPEYLESLIERDMPKGALLLSRMKISRAKSGTKLYTLDIEKGYARDASSGERGWYDANTNLLILAGDCLNSTLPAKKVPVMPLGALPKATCANAGCQAVKHEKSVSMPEIKQPAVIPQPGLMPLGTLPRASCPQCKGEGHEKVTSQSGNDSAVSGFDSGARTVRPETGGVLGTNVIELGMGPEQ